MRDELILVTSANGKTGQHVIPELLAKGRSVRALSRHAPATPMDGVQAVAGDMNDPNVIRRCVEGVEAVIHIGPTLHPREVAIGTGVIDAARDAGVPKFVLFSVIHPQIDDLVNHQNKLALESHLVHSRVDWTILQPQHYMQNIDVRRVVESRFCALPYSESRTLDFVDLTDVAEVAAKVVTEDGHRWATYELSANELLSTTDIAKRIGAVAGVDIAVGRLDVEEIVATFANWKGGDAIDDRSRNGLRRLFVYYDHYGITGNANVLTWLLGRRPNTFTDYAKREIAKGA
jgi:uncharacterized protein YbjT (DUF2867 family)